MMSLTHATLLALLALALGVHGGWTSKPKAAPPALSQWEVAMMETLTAVKEGRAPDPLRRRPDGTPGTLLDALLPEPVTVTDGTATVTDGTATVTDEGEEGQRRRKLAQSGSSWRFFGANIPFLQGPTLAALNASFYRYSSVAPPTSIDWRKTIYITPIQIQYQCASCWVLAAVDAVAMAYGIATRAPAVAGSVQQVCDMPNATYPSCGGKSCCQGGWPEDAFAWLMANGNITSANNYNYWSEDGRTCTLASNYPIAAAITGWEKVPSHSMLDLQKAVSMQPVLVYISASSPDFRNYMSTAPGTKGFKIYDGNCTGEVNHAMLAVGFDTSGAIDYWILKNSWPIKTDTIDKGWGDNGYMYLRMYDGPGKCGLQTVSPLYPVYFPNSPTIATVSKDASPVASSDYYWWQSYKTSSNTCTGIINPCGGGTCYQQNSIARCSCPDGFVEVVGAPTSKCVDWNPCYRGLFNPCGAGACMNVGDGSYICGCPTGYAVGTRVNGAPTCIPLSSVSLSGAAKSVQYMAQYGDTCASIQKAYNIPSTAFSSLNPFLKCASSSLISGSGDWQKSNPYLLPGIVVNLPVTIPSTCSQQYAIRPYDSCSAISYYMDKSPRWFTSKLNSSNYMGGTSNPDNAPTLREDVDTIQVDKEIVYGTASLLSLNPTLNCASLMAAQQVCVAAATSAASSAPAVCGQTYTTKSGDSCGSIANDFKMDSATLLQLNPGLNCLYNGGSFFDGIQICVGTAAVTKSASPMINCTTWYSVQQGDSCAQIWNAANLSQFMLLYINPGLQCQPPFLYVGLQVCIDSPALENIADPNFLLYTVQPNDTWSVIQAQYTSRCLPGSITAKKIVLANSVCAGSATASNLTFPYPFNCSANGTRIGNWTQYNPITGSSLVIPCAPKVGASCGCVDSLVSCGCDLVNYPSYCDARCNFATPLASSSACSACQAACQGIYGLPPDPPSVCPPNYVCPMPVWAPPASDASAVFTSRPLCNYRNKTCTNVCTIFATVNGSPTAVDADCYNLCYACHKVPCVGPSVIVDVGTSPCSTCSVAGCAPAGSGACQIQCSYWNSLYTTLNP